MDKRVTQRCGKTISVIFFTNKNAHFVSTVPKGVLQKIKNKTWQTLGFGAYAGNEGMGGQRRSNTQKTHNALYFQLSTSLSFDLYCPVDIEAVKVSSKIGKMLKKPVPEVVLDL